MVASSAVGSNHGGEAGGDGEGDTAALMDARSFDTLAQLDALPEAETLVDMLLLPDALGERLSVTSVREGDIETVGVREPEPLPVALLDGMAGGARVLVFDAEAHAEADAVTDDDLDALGEPDAVPL